MIQSLTIQNFILIDHIDLQFKNGLIVLSGETGAGKSLILKSLEFIMGAKLAVKPKDESKPLSVTAAFDYDPGLKSLFEEHAIEESPQVLLRRVITPTGASKAYVNDTPVSLQLLKTTCTKAIEFVGQFETIHLTDAGYHLGLLDDYAKNETARQSLEQTFEALTTATKKHKALQADYDTLHKDALFFEEGAAELEALAPEMGEEAKLIDLRRNLAHSEKVMTHLSEAHAYLSEDHGALKFLYAAEKTLLKIPSQMLPNMDDIFESLSRIQDEVSIVSSALDDHKERFLEAIPHFESLDDRLHALRDMARKYKVQPDDLPHMHLELSSKIDQMQALEKNLGALQKEINILTQTYGDQALALSTTRGSAAESLAKAVNTHIAELQWKNVSFKIDHRFESAKTPQRLGLDTITFTVKTNAGQPFEPISKVASGGERSRLLLALKAALSSNKASSQHGTIIFDEIDTGVGGATAEAVGQMLKNLAKSMQVMLITHAPQVAGLAAQHFVVYKCTEKDQTFTRIHELDAKAKQEEIARMLSGRDITDEARAAARKLMVS